MSGSIIENLWSRLDPQTQEWIRANPGTVILPRSVTEALFRAGGSHQELEGVDRNGQLSLSPQDQAFIKRLAASSPVGHPVPPVAPYH
ncbi:MAG TPA: hypothetical protein VLT34_07225 [Arthrobacter sp.]|nr:hypothetical protein [Arthrobacter sp.]